MGWKDWSYSKKGALIGVIVGAILVLAVAVYAMLCKGEACLFLVTPLIPIRGLLDALNPSIFQFKLLAIVMQLVYGFVIIGISSLIGRLIDKIKQRRSIVNLVA